MGAACRLLCYAELAEFALQPWDLCVTAQPDLKSRWTDSTAQYRSALTQVNCDLDHRFLEVQWPPGQNHYVAPLDPHRLYCSQTYYKLQIILGSCSANRKFPDRLGYYYLCHNTHQCSTGWHGARRQVPLRWLLMLPFGPLKPVVRGLVGQT